ncbi:glutathione S-transferase [Stutzerimonas xanthomarina]|uniref:Glutathione S-transferase n=2 Tax=Stutzerimonas xanthomarina TaxID=271420 RepID=A0A1M5MKH7_9GAMM|nr:glutathione S-transferase [Stutzerimonas xanthomarina]MCP9337541.1 glutathione S-transferase [Stutzerimonas xanthomarina]SEH88742.1 glutathione S-transferase [Stutzerimonas xanthomarina]SHG77808.1 glutathione S-transferase [Stutzerimonas xanthomarina DSM 18231]
MLKLWGRLNSTNVKKVLWCLEELNIEYTRVDAGGIFGVVGEADYIAKNPNQLVPCLEDGELVLWESNAIVRYLAAQYGEGILWQVDPAQRAQADKWMDWVTSSLAAPFRTVFWNMVRTAPEQRDMPAVHAATAECGKLLMIADRALSDQPYLSGASFGMGDIPLGCFAYAWFEMPIERPDLPHLQAWYERLRQRTAYQTAVVTPLT